MIILHDKSQIEAFLQKNVFLHIYSLGDLDDFFWPYTIWYAALPAGARQEEGIKAIILLYVGQALPTLLALADNVEAEMKPMKDLLNSLTHLLPRQFYAHLSPGLETVMADQFHLAPHGEHYKMALRDKSRLQTVDTTQVGPLSRQNLAEILALYEASYPGNWFDPRMLDTGQYFGLKVDGTLLSIAGIHVYSKAYQVAALGNITTHPDYRGRRYGQAVTARLCQSLAESVEHIGLNVKADNQGAISLYKKLGFETVCSYGEYMVTTKK